MSELRIARNLRLPLDAVTRATAIVGQRGTGKTSTAVVFVEEAAAAGAHFAVIDPTGAWYGLTSNAAGTGPGLDCVVMGGHNGDVPLEAESGALVARLVVEERYSVVLDLELMTKAKQIQFVAEFGEELYHRNRTALTLVVDEAHRFAPQQLRDPGGYGARCLGAVTDVATLGRRKGLGAVLISQRPAKINKDVFEECEVVVAHRLMGNNDRKQIAGWLEDTDEEAAAEARAALSKLRTLNQGHALVYAPTMEVYGDYLIRRKRTFDSSATPEVGGEVVLPKKRAEVDLAALEQRMAKTLERQKADDPAELKRRVAQLQKELRDRPDVQPEVREVPVLTDEDRQALREVSAGAGQLGERLHQHLRDVGETIGPLLSGLNVVAETIDAKLAATNGGARAVRPAPASAPSAPRPSTPPPPPSSEAPELKAGARRMLETLCRISPVRVSKAQLATLVGMKVTGGTYNTYFSKLRREGLIDESPDRLLEPTDAGFAYLGGQRPAPLTQEEVVETWRGALKRGARRMLDILLERHPDWIAKAELGELLGMEPSGGTFNTYVSTLRRNGLAEVQGGEVRAGEALFLGVPA